MMHNLQYAGKIGKPHGIQGAITLHCEVDIDWDKLYTIFIELDGSPVPYLVEKIAFTSKKIIVKLKLVSSIQEAQTLVHKKFYVPKELIVSHTYEEYIGYTIFDVNAQQPIGILLDWQHASSAEWIIVKHHSTQKEILLPYHSELIQDIDKDNKIIYYKAIKGMYE